MKIPQMTITNKLLFLNLMIFIVFGTIIITVSVTFHRVEKLSSSVILRDINQLIYNSRFGRQLSELFIKSDQLIRTFYKDDELLNASGKSLLASAEALMHHVDDVQRLAIHNFNENVKLLISECHKINQTSQNMNNLLVNMNGLLTTLSEVIAEKIITNVLNREDGLIHRQLGALIPTYREGLLQSALAVASLIPSRFETRETLIIIEQLDYLHLRIRTLLASEPDISEYGKKLLDDIIDYKMELITFNNSNIVLKATLVELHQSEEQALTILNDIDAGILNTTSDIDNKIQEILRSSLNFISICSGIEIILFGVFTYFFFLRNIRLPMETICRSIESVREGNLDMRIRLDRQDEWNVVESALNRMTSELKESYEQIRYQNQALREAHLDLKNQMKALESEVAQRQQTEYKLQKSQERYRRFFEDDLSAAFIASSDGHLITCNPAYIRMFGFDSIEQALDHDMTTIYPSQSDYDHIIRMIREKMKIIAYESEYRRMDGSMIHVVGNYTGTFEQCELLELKGYLIDISARKNAESEREKLRSQLQHVQKMESLGTLAGGVAHDFNNLLMGIQGRISLIKIDAFDLTPSHLDHLNSMEEYVKSAANLTKQLLGFARGGKYEVLPLNLNELIQKNNQIFCRTYKEIVIHEILEEHLWTVEADRGQIEQVLLNLCLNAWQAMPHGGDITIRTENRTIEDGYTQTFSVMPGNYVKLSITDTGIGIDEEIKEKIFDPFFTTKEKGRGTGLGLASAYGIIKNHGGFILVESQKGQGTTFTIHLPASEKEIPEKKTFAEETKTGSETILLVDDEAMILQVGSELLKFLGYHVLKASSGMEAVEIYHSHRGRIHLVILDMIMPKMDGGIVFDRLKEIDPNAKVILSSGYTVDGKASEIMSRGCSGFLQKPFNIVELSDKVREVLDTVKMA